MRSLVGQVGGFASLALAIAIGYGAYHGLDAYADIRITATTLVALAGTLTGFLLTALSLLIGIADRPFIENLRMTGHYRQLIRKIFKAAGLWLCVVAIGLAGHIVAAEVQRIVISLAMGLATLALLYFLSVGSKFSKVVNLLTRR